MEYNYSATAPCIYSELADIALEDKFPCDCGFRNRSDDQIEEKCETIPAISCVPDGRSGSLGSGNVAHPSLEVERKRQKSVVSLSSSGVLAPDSMDSGDTTGDNKRNGGKRQKQQKPKPKQKQQLSVDPQSIAARQRRHRISKKFKILQSMVPGGSKMDTASMLDEAIQYVKFLKMQIWLHDQTMASLYSTNGMISAATHCSTGCDDPASQIFSQNAANMPYTACNSTTVGLVQRNPAASAGSIDSIGGILYGAAVNDRYYT